VLFYLRQNERDPDGETNLVDFCPFSAIAVAMQWSGSSLISVTLEEAPAAKLALAEPIEPPS
jgi:hypothetical protein